MKKIISLLMSLAMLASAALGATSIVYADESPTWGKCGDNASWNYDLSTQTLTISGTGDMYDYSYSDESENKTPWNIYNKNIYHVMIENGVNKIGNSVFGECFNLVDVDLPESIDEIGRFAFYDCQSIEQFTVPKNVKSIGDYALFFCYITKDKFVNYSSLEYNVNWGLTIIDSDTNGMCIKDNELVCVRPVKVTDTVVIPDGVSSIEQRALYWCNDVENITIPDSVTKIGADVFNRTKLYKNKDNWINGILYIGNHLIKAEESVSGYVEIKKGTKSIADSAFDGCKDLTKVKLPDGIVGIGDNTFSGCGLTEISIPNSVTYIGSMAFQSCKFSDLTLPENLKSIGAFAFHLCENLKNISIPDGVTSIGQLAFWKTAYDKNTDNWDNGILYIGNHIVDAHSNSSNSITIKKSIKTIANKIFCAGRFDSLTDVYFAGTKDEWNNIKIGEENDYLIKATLHCQGTTPTPTPGSGSTGGGGGGAPAPAPEPEKPAEVPTAPSKPSTTAPVVTATKPATVKATGTKSKTKALAVYWSKQSGVDGYQIQVATDKKFKKNKKTVTVQKQNASKKTVKNLKKNKKYYVRVRSYKIVNGKKVYGGWSKVKSVKTK